MADMVHAQLDTSLDVVDTSKRVTETMLSDTEIKFLFTLSETQGNLLEEVEKAIDPIAVALEMTPSVLIRSNLLEVIFK